jgi:hypothetical protein
MSWREEPDPAMEAENLLDLAVGSELTTRGRWIAWVNRARKLPSGLKVWLIERIRDKISDQAGDYLWQHISRRGKL